MSQAAAGLLDFPCDFPVKAFGLAEPDFAGHVLALVRRHAPATPEEAVGVRPSRAGKYCSVTVRVRAESQSQLDAIYRELTGSPRITMAL